MTPDSPRGPGLFEVTNADGETRITNVRRIAGTERDPGSLLVAWSTALLALLDAGLFYVSWWGQYLFIFAARHQDIPAMIEAGMFDTGQVIFTGLSLGLARKGRSSKTERFLIQACAVASAAMNYAAADTASARSVVAFTAAPVFAAIVTDRVVSVVRRHALGIEEPSAWKGPGTIPGRLRPGRRTDVAVRAAAVPGVPGDRRRPAPGGAQRRAAAAAAGR